MEKIKSLLNELLDCSPGEAQISNLQRIEQELVQNYLIELPGIVIQPLWLEAYYYDTKRLFLDESVHKSERQTRYNVLYFHHKTDDRRSGVDICLSSDESCYLSFLLKYTLVNGVFTTQSQLSKMIPSDLRDSKDILKFRPNPSEVILFTKRIGVTSGGYQDKKLAVVRDFNRRFQNADGKTKSLPDKTNLLKEYIATNYPEKQRLTDAQKANISRQLIGEYWRSLF